MKRFALSLSLILVVSDFAASQRPAPPRPAPKPVTVQQIVESGSFTEGRYKNRSLGFSVEVPLEWDLFSEELNKSILEEGKGRIASARTGLSSGELNNSIANTRILFTARPQGDLDGGVVALGVEVTPGGYTKDKYAATNRDLVLRSLPGSSIRRGLHERTLGGVQFVCFELEMPSAVGPVGQIYFVTMRGRSSLFAVITFLTDEQRVAMEAMLGSIKFD